MDMEMIQSIGPIVVLALFLIFLAIKAFMNKEGEASVKEFLNTLSDKMEGIIVDHLDEIDFKDFHNLADIENKILSEIYDQIWKLTIAALEKSTESAFAKMLIKKYLTKETVEAFIKYIFSSNTVQIAYTTKYNRALLSANNIAMTVEDAEQLENETVEESKKINTEKVTLTDRDKNWSEEEIENDPGKAVNTELNPAIDADEIPVSLDDSSIEKI